MNVKSKKVQQGEATRQALLQAARELFGERGYAATSLDEVAQAAKVTKGALYHHYSGKQELFGAVYEQVKREVSERAATAFLEPDPWEDLCTGCEAMLDAHLDPLVRRILLHDAQAVLDADTIRRVENRYGAVVLRGALRRSVRAGVIQPLPLKTLALMLTGAILEGCMDIAHAEDPEQAREDVGNVLTSILEGLRPDANTGPQSVSSRRA
ncbi:MAG TPA: TetR/AcrR family transcriptional regulator [Solirubrobacteraceae bacterium]|nr:TetR/AcrR family transcriptional regulator [Solirubrobacteraceae bacterium]